jgi:hypothetical protein
LFAPKLTAFRGLVEGFLPQPGVKIVIFSQWQRMLRLCHWAVSDLLADAGVEAVFITGHESQKRRTENIVRFHDDSAVRLFFATDAGGVGLNLQKAASVCINLELPWNPAVLEQRNGRIYRLGQTSPVQIFNLITQNTIEDRITELVGRKKAVFDELFDGTSDEVRFEGRQGFYQQVQKIMGDLNAPSQVTIDVDEGDEESPEMIESMDEAIPELVTADAEGTDESLADPESESLEPAKLQPEPSIPASVASWGTNLDEAFRGIRVNRTEAGGVRLEAEGPSAALLSKVFRGMADLFGSLGS